MEQPRAQSQQVDLLQYCSMMPIQVLWANKYRLEGICRKAGEKQQNERLGET